jgi:hypothetical protein
VEAVFGAGAIDLAIAESVEIKLELMKRAEEVRQFWVDYWESFDHPYSREHTLRSGYVERPGDYAKSIKVKFIEAGPGTLFKARITAHDYKAHWIEYGSSRMPEFAPRAATLSHFGGGTAVS